MQVGEAYSRSQMTILHRVRPRSTAARLRPWHIITVILGGYLALTLAAHGGDPMAFVIVGTRFDPGLPDGSMGYDGQFAYQMTLDPLNGWQRLNPPAYRYQRILYPALGKTFRSQPKRLATVVPVTRQLFRAHSGCFRV